MPRRRRVSYQDRSGRIESWAQLDSDVIVGARDSEGYVGMTSLYIQRLSVCFATPCADPPRNVLCHVCVWIATTVRSTYFSPFGADFLPNEAICW